MRLLTTGLLLASLFTLASPSEVEAQGKGWWGWLERLSGPGNFEADPSWKMALEFDRLICLGKDGKVGSAFSVGNIRSVGKYGNRVERPCDRSDTPTWFLSFHVSPLTNEDIEKNSADWGATNLTRSLFMFYVNPLPKASRRVLHLGAGAGFYHFAGQGSADRADERYTNNEVVIPVRLRLTPFATPKNGLVGNLRRSFYWEGGWDFLPGPIDAAEFNSSAVYSKKNDWLWTHRLVLNLTTLIGF